jgi:hypothetical protein
MIPAATTSTPQNQIKVDRNNPESIRQYMLAQNVPVEFYGKVVDQDANPISGAHIQGEALHIRVIFPAPGGAQDEIIPINQESDSNGRFEVQGMTGRGLVIESVQKDGYEPEPWQHSSGALGGSFDNPIIFKMWSTNIHEQLITGEKKFQIVPDGRTYFINLTEGTIAESGAGDLKVWVKRPDGVKDGDRFDWSSEVDAVSGGLLQETDGNSPMFSAPTDGYLPSFLFGQKAGSGWGDSTGSKRFYIMLLNGKMYGRISIELYAYYNNQIPGLIRLSYAINPSGSRILR